MLHNLVEASTGLFRYPYTGRLAATLRETEPVCIIVEPITEGLTLSEVLHYLVEAIIDLCRCP